jgi:hypothetical protein
MTDDAPPTVRCKKHGVRTAAVVCGHLVKTDEVRGFVENSSEPDDLQGWCDRCEAMFLKEGDRTPAFRAFHDMAVVCDLCYVRIRKQHSRDA